MKQYRLRDVPAGKRPGYVWTYYKWRILAALFAAVTVGYLAYATWFAWKTDVSVMWISSQYELLSDAVIRERLGEIPWDANGDGRVKVAVQHVEFGENEKSLSPENRMMLLALMGAGEFNVLLVNEPALSWAKEQEILGTWKEFDGRQGDELFVIPCSLLAFFKDTGIENAETMYLTIAHPPKEEDGLKQYRAQMDGLKKLMEWDGENYAE